jgi:uncharacterized YigZ family protein
MIQTIARVSQIEIKIQNSIFIGIAIPCKDLQDFQRHLNQVRNNHPKANHICFAYRVGFKDENTRSNDDGEPSGTAGKPIFNQLLSLKIQNCVVFVIRYFGGTKLGVSGLIEAYKGAAKMTLELAETITSEPHFAQDFLLEPEQYYRFIAFLKSIEMEIQSQEYDNNYFNLKLEVPESKKKLISDYFEK